MSELIALPGFRRPSDPRISDSAWVAVATQTDPRRLNLPEEIRSMVGSGWVEELVLDGENRPEVLATVVEAARACGRRVRLVTSVQDADLPRALDGECWTRDEDGGRLTCVLAPRRRPRWKLALKRLIDIAVSGLLLVLLFPVLITIGLAIKLTSDGPILYRWRVLGENGRPFVGFKFRTMVRDADALKVDLLHLNERQGPIFKIAKDPRTTAVGRWLRKHSFDELPQLWSVLTGDMSLVGPRPPSRAEYSRFELWQMRKLSVKVGLTCLWQVHGRTTLTDFADWARLDLQYIDTWSLLMDLDILARTVIVVIQGTGS